MTKCWKVLAVTALFGAGAACTGERYSRSAFSLPPDGNAENGKRAFLDLGCPSCHNLAGEPPGAAVQSADAVTLGGEVERKLSDAYLFTALIYPAHALAPLPKERITTGGVSRMPAFADKISVRQAIDMVAFLQTHYTVHKRAPSYAYR